MARLTEVDVDFISLVSKGANKQKINIYKSDDYEPNITQNENNEEMKGFFNLLKSFFNKDSEQKEENRKESEGIEMKKEDIAEIVKEAIQPLSDRLDDIEKDDKSEGEQTETKETELSKEDIAKAVTDAIAPLTDRIEKIENFKGISKQEEGTDQTDVNKSTSTFAGINI